MRNFLTAVLVLLLTGSLQAADENLQTFLIEFHRNPYKMMGKLPPEVKDGKVIDRGFLNSEFLDRNLLLEKSLRRQEVKSKAVFETSRLFSAIREGDDPRALIEGGVANANILELDRLGLMKHSLPYTIWSDSYWPIYKGLLAHRYADPGFPESKDWNVNYGYYLAVPTFAVGVDNLSPAEKYDLLVGDTNMTMTNFSWRQGRQYIDRYGRVPSWMGICHGWSAATHMNAKIPFGSIVLKSPNGTSIRFYQSDVKALQSMLWANASPQTRFLGFRCHGTPPRDSTGRTIDENCRDTNAASFFLSLTNQLGIHNRSFVMDATYDAEVWNFSVISYRGTYFNPQTLQQTDNVRKAIVPVSQFTIDKFKPVRHPNTAYVVGVTMDVTYMNETAATQRVQTKPATKTNRYVYDLELDANMNVIGGEWYTRAHPDFLWSYAADAQAVAPGDADIIATDWNTAGPVPATWAEAARKSSNQGIPLYSVIQRILEAAPTWEDYQRENPEAESGN